MRRTLEHIFEALLHQLVCSADQVEAIYVVELRCDLAPKQPACPSRRNSPGLNVLRVAPHEVAEGPFVRDLAHSLYGPNLQRHHSSLLSTLVLLRLQGLRLGCRSQCPLGHST
jgi:hypothetical protein